MKRVEVTRAVAVCKILANTNNGRIFSATFIKKDGSIRTMRARKGVTKGLKGGQMKYTPLDKALMGVFDMDISEYRMVNLDGLIKFSANGIKYEVV